MKVMIEGKFEYFCWSPDKYRIDRNASPIVLCGLSPIPFMELLSGPVVGIMELTYKHKTHFTIIYCISHSHICEIL
jgi:hypothetical protein